jgi:hypothetical protein
LERGRFRLRRASLWVPLVAVKGISEVAVDRLGRERGRKPTCSPRDTAIHEIEHRRQLFDPNHLTILRLLFLIASPLGEI